MSFCPSCGVEVREGKAFCYNCGAPMTQSAAPRDDQPSPDLFKETVVVPPPRARDSATPRRDSSAEERPQHVEPRRPAPDMFDRPDAARNTRRKFSYGKFGLGVVLLLLLVVLGLFVLAVLAD